MTECRDCGTILRDGEQCDCGGMKKCPQCCMAIPRDASVCGYCRASVSTGRIAVDAAAGGCGLLAGLIWAVPIVIVAAVMLRACTM
jgi:hypothetical protein